MRYPVTDVMKTRLWLAIGGNLPGLDTYMVGNIWVPRRRDQMTVPCTSMIIFTMKGSGGHIQ